jgi:hypothetical protein
MEEVALVVVLALVLGLVAVLVRLGLRNLRTPEARIDPFAVREPWRAFVQNALQARSRFRNAIGSVAEGPLRDRLLSIGERFDRGAEEAWAVARRGQKLQDVRRHIDVPALQRELEAVGEASATSEALRSQLATARRIDGVLEETHAHLRLLDARLDEAVVRSLELSVRTEDPAALGGVGNTVDEVLEEMEALRLALDEADVGPTFQ